MYKQNCLAIVLCVVLCVSCGVKRSRLSETTVVRDSLHFQRHDSLRAGQWFQREEDWHIEWKEVVLSVPDSSGRQFVQTLRVATADAGVSEQQTTAIQTGKEEILCILSDSKNASTKNKFTISFPFYIFMLLLPCALAVFLYKYFKSK